MAKREIKVGATDQTIDIFLQDSSSTVGAGLASLVYNTANLKCYYRKGATGTATALTLATQTVGGAHSDGGFVEIDATNMKGVYRLDLSDTMVAAAGMLTIYVYGATNLAPMVAEIEVVATDKYDAVRGGMTALPNANADAAGGLPISDAGGLDLDAKIGALTYTVANKVDANVTHAAGTAWASGAITAASVAADVGTEIAAAVWDEARAGHLAAGSFGEGVASVQGNVTGNVAGSVGSVTGNVGGNVTGSVGSVAAGGITAASIATGAIDADSLAADAGAEIADAVWDEATAGHTTAGSTGKAVIDILEDTTEIGAAGAGLTNINLPDQTMNITGDITGNLSGSVGSVTGAVGSVTGAVGSVTGAVGSVTGNVGGNVTGSVGSVAAGGITASSIATGAVDADALAADAVTEIVAGILGGEVTELAAIPAASPTLEEALALLYMALRNKIDVTSSAKEIHNSAGTVIATKALTDDGTTYSEAKMA